MYSNLKSSISTLEQAHSEIQQLQVASPVHMYRANSKATTWTTTIGSSVTSSTEDTNSDQGQTANGSAVNGAQQQYHHQRQVTLPSFQLSFGKNIQGQVSQIIDDGRASPVCWPTESPACWSTETPACWPSEAPACQSTESPVSWPTEAPISVESVAGLRHENIFQLEGLPVSGLKGVQVQGDHISQIISNTQILQSHGTYPNLIAAGAVSSTPSYQQIEGVIPNQTGNAGTEISCHQLQKLPEDPNNWQNVATVTNPATMSASNKHSQVFEYAIPNLAIAATATTDKMTESQTSNSELNAPRRMRRCTCPNCRDPDKRNSESGEKHICHFHGCTKMFKYPSKLQIHIRSHTGEKPFVCTWVSCGKRFRLSENLLRHRRTHTAQHLQKLPDDANKWHNVATVTNPATMSASNKNSQVNENAIPNLAITAAALTAELTKSQTSNSELNDPLRMQRNNESGEKHICHFHGCTRVFKYPSQLQAHIRSHTGEKPFVCTWVSCKKRFGRNEHLQRHGRTHTAHQLQKLPDDANKWHNGATVTNPATMSANPDKKNNESREKHICDFPGCTKVFKYAFELEAHIRSHTGEKPFVCTWVSCGKRFRRSKDLQRHERTHTDEKRFKCTECFKRFTRRYILSKHFERFHSKRTFQEPI